MIRKILLASLMTIASTSAFATSQTWDFSTGHTNGTGNGNTLQFSQGGIDLTMTAWASTGEGCATYHAAGINFGNDQSAIDTDYVDADSCIESAKLEQITQNNGNYLGIGIQNRTESPSNVWPDHGIDNSSHDYDDPELEFEMVLLSFSQEVVLADISAGLAWSNDSDTSVAAFNPTNGQTFNGAFGSHTTWSDIVGNGSNGGWELVSANSSFPSTSGGTLSVSDASTEASRYWLVGALNTALGGPRWSDMNDSFKFEGISTIAHTSGGGTDPVNANAPATFGLFLLFGYFLLRRKS